jgi:uncharacterized protein (DUF2141 family)
LYALWRIDFYQQRTVHQPILLAEIMDNQPVFFQQEIGSEQLNFLEEMAADPIPLVTKSMHRRIKFIFSVVVFTVLLNLNGFAQDPFIPKYNAVKRSERCFTVTYDKTNQFGAVWWADKVNFSADTSFNFVVYMGDRDGGGADGLAFVMHQDSRDITVDATKEVKIGGGGTFDLEAATGDDGGGLGYAMHTSRVNANTIPGPHPNKEDNHRIWPSVAVEIDTWNNGDVPDGRNGTDGNGVTHIRSPFYTWDHTSVVYNGNLYSEQQIISDGQGNSGRILPLKPSHVFGTGNNPDGSSFHNIEDNRCYLFQIKWDVHSDGTQSMELWADVYNGSTNLSGLQMVMTHRDSILSKVFNNDPVLRFGFTGSTGGSRNEQTICLLGENLKPFAQNDFASIPLNTSTVINVEANDNDPDGDQLHVPIIIEPAKNGSAVIFDSVDVNNDNVNFMRYTPDANYTGNDSLAYVTCDVNSTKCYAKCDTAWVYINVGCLPFSVDATALSPHVACVDSMPGNGSAQAIVNNSPFPGTIWFENFSNKANGTTSDSDTTSWSITNSGGCHASSEIFVQDEEFMIRRSVCEVVWESQVIDIAAFTNITLSVDVRGTGGLDPPDYVNVYYKLDGGAEVPFDKGLLTSGFGSAHPTAEGLNGSTIQVVVRMKNSGGDERYFLDNVLVQGQGAAIGGFNYHWYAGNLVGGTPDFTGQTVTGLRPGPYTIVAIEPGSGCRSTPTTVLIDSTGTRPTGGYVKQNAPYTYCDPSLTPNGALEAGVFNGTDSLNLGYLFEWYYRESPKVGSPIRTGYRANNLVGREYSVVITELATGCDTLVSGEVVRDVVEPSVDASVLSDVISCIDPNSGIAEANVGDSTNGYTFEWWAGNVITAAPPDFVGDTINTLPEGWYMVRATNNTSLCPSSGVPVFIDSQLRYPGVVVNKVSDQISCDSTQYTGEFDALAVSGTDTTTTGFSFNWYKGFNDVTPARPGYSGGPAVDRLAAGNYRLIVTNDTTSCATVVDTSLVEILTFNNITGLDVDSVTSCSAIPNGQITVAIDGVPADFSYQLYRGNAALVDSLIIDQSLPVFQNLGVGDYTITARNNITHCLTAPAFATVDDATVLPMADISTSPQTSCDPMVFTGEVEATPLNAGSFGYQWFEDSVNGTAVGNTATVSALDSGIYAVIFTDLSTECTNTFFAQVDIDQDYPVISAVTSVPATHCAPNPNGELHAVAVGSNLAYAWADDGSNSAGTAADVLGVAPGDYTVTVTNTVSTCVSGPVPVNVADNTITPTPAIAVNDNNSCDVLNPNGNLEVTNVTNEPGFTKAKYAYDWYRGVSVATGTQLTGTFPNTPDSSLVSLLNEDRYTLRITNKTTYCTNDVISIITDINIKPTLDFPTITDATRCAEPYMSGIVVTGVNGAVPNNGDYFYELFAMPALSSVHYTSDVNILDDAPGGAVIPAGDYKLVVYNGFNCPSDTVEFEIKDKSVDPLFTLSGYDNITCDLANPVGIVEAATDGSYAVSTVEWFIGSVSGSPVTTIGSASIIEDDTLATGLPGNDYAVRLTADNACTAVQRITIDDVPGNKPLLDTLFTKDLTSCLSANGEISLTVGTVELLPPDLSSNRTYTFTMNNPVAGLGPITLTSDPAVNPGTVVFTNLPEGTWIATVRDDYSLCVSDPLSITIKQAPSTEFNTLLDFASICTLADGEIRLEVSTPVLNESPGGMGFDFEWFDGKSTAGTPLTTVTTIDGWTSEADMLESQFYSIRVTDRFTGCVKDTSIFLPSAGKPIIQTPTAHDATQCAPSNGYVEVMVDEASFTAPLFYDDYNFIVYEGTSFEATDTPYRRIDNPVIAPGGSVVFPADFAPGKYTVVVQEDFPSNCLSDPKVVEIGLDFDITLNPQLVVSDSSCTGGTPTGVLDEAYNNMGYGITQVDYAWFAGSSATGPAIYDPAAGTAATIGALANGTYTVQLTVSGGAGLGCVAEKSINVPKLKTDERINAVINPNMNCSPYNGAISLSDITIDGFSNALSRYEDFRLSDEGGNVLSTAPHSATAWSGLAPGTYYVTAKKSTTQCITKPMKADVADDASNPVLNVVMNNANYNCNGPTPTGQLSATASSNVGGASFGWTWTGINVPGSTVDNPTTSVASALVDKVYNVRVTDTDGDGRNDGCATARNATVTKGSSAAYILTPQLSKIDQTICGPNGSIRVDRIDEDRNGALFAQETPAYISYGASLFTSTLNPIDDVANAYAAFNPATGFFGAADIPAGTYYVRAENAVTGCSFGPPTQVIIKDVSKRPIINLFDTIPDYACLGGTPTGEIKARALGGTDANAIQANFSFDWEYANNPGVNTPTGAGAHHATTLAAGQYIITVEDINGADQFCTTQLTYNAAKKTIPFKINTVAGTDQTVCFPNASGHVVEIDSAGTAIASGVAYFSSRYEVMLSDAQLNAISPAPAGTGIVPDPFSAMSAGVYNFKVRDRLTNCFTGPKQLQIQNTSTKPVVASTLIQPQYSLNPDPATWTGELLASAAEADGSIGAYSYNWYQGTAAAGPVVSTTDGATELDADYYTILVQNTATMCEKSISGLVPFERRRPEFLAASFPQTLCLPPDGRIELSDIALDNAPAPDVLPPNQFDMAAYTFHWHNDTYDAANPDNSFVGTSGITTYPDLSAGTYYVVAVYNHWMLPSEPLQIMVEDSLFFPVIVYDDNNSRDQTSCDPATSVNGAVAVNVYEENTGLPATYTYIWAAANGTDYSDSLRNQLTGLPVGSYTVQVTNSITGCVREKAFPVADAVKIPVLTASSSPVTNCDPTMANGNTSAFVINSNFDMFQDTYYDFNWYEGTELKATPDHQGQSWEDIKDGIYTVQAVDKDVPTCRSQLVAILVAESTTQPVIGLQELSPVTNCDALRPNGAYLANADGKTTGYLFDWYNEGGLVHATGPAPTELGNETYTLIVRNISTGCTDSAQVKPSFSPELVPAPDVEILSDRTSCVAPDGISTASINGNVTDYRFFYYYADNGDPLPNVVIDYKVYDMDEGDYFVTAQSRKTGCFSEPTPFSLANERYFPEIKITTTPSNCQDPTGTAEVYVADPAIAYKVYWYGDNGFEAQGEFVNMLPFGNYDVLVEGSDGCFTETTTTVNADVLIYNGVSDNNDGKNDFFHILCLEMFANNNVKIFNRAGQMVYEMDNYDMNDPARRFHGIANRGGINLGTQLPIGTYFYVVDKGDGSKAKVGYLELNR